MDCRQVRAALEENLNSEHPPEGGQPLEQFPELGAHLDQCPECQAWYDQELWAVRALEHLETIQPSSDFVERVLSSLPDAVPKETVVPTAQPDSYLDRIRTAWDAIASGLARPARRRTLMPALALAATLLVVLGLVYVLQGGDVPSTPGMAAGASSWIVGIGVVVVVAAVVVALVVWRRKD